VAEPAHYRDLMNMTTQHWYAIYTKYNAEKKLSDCILNHSNKYELNYQTYLPLSITDKQWSDRSKQVHKPLFSNYLFVKHDQCGFYYLKSMPGFSYYVRFGAMPTIIPEQQMELIRQVVSYQKNTYTLPKKLVKGDVVKICKGALAGYQGVLLQDQQNHMIAIEIKSLQIFLNVHISITDVVPMDKTFSK